MRPLSRVRHTEEWMPIYDWMYKKEDAKSFGFIYLGEIPNMLGHGVFISCYDSKIYTGMHLETFEEIPEDEDA